MRQREGRNIKPLKPPKRIESDDETEVVKKIEEPLVVDSNMPSTSGLCRNYESNKDTDSIYSQETVIGEDSDEDFQVSPVHNQKHNMDKNKKMKNKLEPETPKDNKTCKRLYEQVFNECQPVEDYSEDSSYETIFELNKSATKIKKNLNSSTPEGNKNKDSKELTYERCKGSQSPEMFEDSFCGFSNEAIVEEKEIVNGHFEVFQGFPGKLLVIFTQHLLLFAINFTRTQIIP